MESIIRDLLSRIFDEPTVESWLLPVTIIAIILSAYLTYIFCHGVVAVVVKIITRYTTNEWDDDLLNDRVLRAFSQLAPALLVAWLLPDAFELGSQTFVWLTKFTKFYIVWACVHLVNQFLQSFYEALDKREKYKIHTLRGVLQMLKLFFICVGVIVGLSILFDKSPIAILTAFGASAAILMLVFKDTILGLVAGVQLSANDMLKKGDWIIVPKAGANGEVIDVSLTAVKIRNWDNSVTTVPPYALISDSFQNYNPMRDSGGRRVARSIYIDMNTIRFCSEEELEILARKGWLEGFGSEQAAHTVNLALFSRYLEYYISHHPSVRDDMLIMVRQMPPTPQGLPLELYFFANDTGWRNFEHIQSDIFNHVYAVIHEFGLSVFQVPAGSDLAKIQGFVQS